MPPIGGIDLTGTVRSLLNIEVNTIISDTMSADHMPPLAHAVLDIADWYADYMCRAGVDLRPFLTLKDVDQLATVPAEWSDAPSFTSAMLVFSAATFQRLRAASKAALDNKAARKLALTRDQEILFYRIEQNCEAIEAMFSHFGPDVMGQFGGKDREGVKTVAINRSSYFIPPDDLVTLQKIWDLGVDRVIAQTIVFLNGNVTTRIQAMFQDPSAQTLFGIHRQSVDVSVGCWHYLLQAIQEIAGAAIGTLLGRRV